MMVHLRPYYLGDILHFGGEVPEKNFHDKSGLKAVSAISCGFFLFQEMLCLLWFLKAGGSFIVMNPKIRNWKVPKEKKHLRFQVDIGFSSRPGTTQTSGPGERKMWCLLLLPFFMSKRHEHNSPTENFARPLLVSVFCINQTNPNLICEDIIFNFCINQTKPTLYKPRLFGDETAHY